MFKAFLVTILLLSSCFYLRAQIAGSLWKEYFAIVAPSDICVAGITVYCKDGNFVLRVDNSTGEFSKMSKLTGLSDYEISCIDVDSSTGALVIAYANGNIDIVRETEIVNIPDFMNFNGKINDLVIRNGKAYFSTNLGPLSLDIAAAQIEDFSMFPSGYSVNDMCFGDTALYVATNKGVFYTNSFDFLPDFSSWRRLNYLPNPAARFQFCRWNNGKLYALRENQSSDTLYAFSGTTGLVIQTGDISNLRVSCGGINYFIWGYAYDENNTPVSNPVHVYDIVCDGMGNKWLASVYNGIVKVNNSNEISYFKPQSPASNNVFDLEYKNGFLYSSAGAYNASWGNTYRSPEINIFNSGSWQTINRNNSPLLNNIIDITGVRADPFTPGRVYASSWGTGLVEINNNIVTGVYNDTNSTLQSIFPGSQYYIRIKGMAFDSSGNLWITNAGVSSPFSVLTANGEWHSMSYGSQSSVLDIGELIISSSNFKWVIFPRGNGLFVFDDNATFSDISDDNFRKLSVVDSGGNTISNDIYTIIQDRDSSILIGTNQGVYYYDNPDDVFASSLFYAKPLIVDTISNKAFLENEIVKDISIDKSGNKWFATEASGVFCLSADNKRVLYHFTKQTHPMFSDNVLTIAASDDKEIFFGTDKGIVSFRDTMQPYFCSMSVSSSVITPSALNNDGAVSLSFTNGTLPVSYVWSSGLSGASNSNLVPGEYYITATDAAGCRAYHTAIVPQRICDINVSAVITEPTYFNSNGSIMISANNTTGNIEILWSNLSTGTYIDSLVPGYYVYTITDSVNCFFTDTLIMPQQVCALSANVNFGSPTCRNRNGFALVNITSGISPFEIFWSDSSELFIRNNMTPGLYTFYLRDSVGCEVADTFVLDQQICNIALAAETGSPLPSESNGWISLSVNGGSNPYQFAWSNGGTEKVITDLSEGIYSVTVTDSCFCSATATYALIANDVETEILNNSKFTLSPNPVNNTLRVEAMEPLVFSIYNQQGVLLYTSDIKGLKFIDLSWLQPSVYIVGLACNGYNSRTRIVKL